MNELLKTVRVIRGKTVDLEVCMFKLEKGRTYYNRDISILNVHIEAGLADGSLKPAKRDRDTITISARDLSRS
jgi:hypothetical protein